MPARTVILHLAAILALTGAAAVAEPEPASVVPSGGLDGSGQHEGRAKPRTKDGQSVTNRLRTSGNKILWNGAPVRLRGVSPGEEYRLHGHGSRPLSDYEVMINGWRSNVIRTSVFPGDWETDPAGSKAALDEAVQRVLANHAWPVIDWHPIGWPDGASENSHAGASMALARSFWNWAAEKYGQDRRIIFEIWNEPTKAPGAAWGCVASWPKLKPYLQELVDIVRARSQNLIIASGPDWTYDIGCIKDSPLAGGNIAYAWHVYPNRPQSSWSIALGNLDLAFPVVVTEWGFCPTCKDVTKGTLADYGIPFAKFMNERQLSWIAWVWSPSWRPMMLRDDWSTPTKFGAFVREELAKGTPARP